MRLFVAVWPPPPVVDVLAGLDRPAVDGLRWTTPAQWHVTLRFIGWAEPSSVGPLPEVGGRLLSLGPATVRLGRHVLAVPVDGLDDVVEDGRPHLTLARAKGGIPGSLVGVPASASWTSGPATLVASETLPGGARYTILRDA